MRCRPGRTVVKAPETSTYHWRPSASSVTSKLNWIPSLASEGCSLTILNPADFQHRSGQVLGLLPFVGGAGLEVLGPLRFGYLEIEGILNRVDGCRLRPGVYERQPLFGQSDVGRVDVVTDRPSARPHERLPESCPSP